MPFFVITVHVPHDIISRTDAQPEEISLKFWGGGDLKRPLFLTSDSVQVFMFMKVYILLFKIQSPY